LPLKGQKFLEKEYYQNSVSLQVYLITVKKDLKKDQHSMYALESHVPFLICFTTNLQIDAGNCQ